MPDLHGWITQQIERTEAIARAAEDRIYEAFGEFYIAEAEAHIELHSPAAVLRRCTADRKILEEHQPQGGGYPSHYACEGCGYDGTYCPEPITEHVNDCPTLQALAEGYGLTKEQRAALDRPEPEPPKPRPPVDLTALVRLMSAKPTSSVPPALRGPNWKARP